MNAREIQNAARGFVQQMKDDVRNKLNQFLRESGITIRQMARDLGLNEDELDRIQHGDGRADRFQQCDGDIPRFQTADLCRSESEDIEESRKILRLSEQSEIHRTDSVRS